MSVSATPGVTASRVSNPIKAITSRSGLNKAIKTRETLATAAAILRMSSSDTIRNEAAARQIDANIADLNVQIARWFKSQRS
jgi:hypothetical protein